MITPPAALQLAVLSPAAIWPLMIGALASVVACSAAAAAVVAQRYASRRRRGGAPTRRP